MTRAAAETGFERFVTDAITATREAFSIGNALRDTPGPSNVVDRLVSNDDRLERHVVEPELRAYERQILRQFQVTLDAVENDEPFDALADRILARDSYYESLRDDLPSDRREEIERALIDRQRSFGEAIAPLVASDAGAFWPAVRDAYDQPAAERLVTERFRFTDPLDRFPDAFVFATELDPADVLGGLGGLFGGLPTLRVEYTAEARRALDRAERQVIRETKRELTRQYDE